MSNTSQKNGVEHGGSQPASNDSSGDRNQAQWRRRRPTMIANPKSALPPARAHTADTSPSPTPNTRSTSARTAGVHHQLRSGWHATRALRAMVLAELAILKILCCSPPASDTGTAKFDVYHCTLAITRPGGSYLHPFPSRLR